MLLNVQALHVSYGAIRAVHGVSFEVDEGEIVTLSGPTARANRKS
jgi:branched-chain amino acid transport system ATP-binding protein